MKTPLIVFVLAPIMLGLFMYISHFRWTKLVSVLLQSYLVIASLYYIPIVRAQREVIDLLSEYHLPYGMSLRLDSLSLVMLILCQILFFSTIVFNLHKPYMNKLFMFLFLSLQGLVSGVFLSNDFFNIYILVEVATVVVSILIMYKKDAMSMYDGMLYLLVNLAGMAFFLFGIGYIYKIFGVFDFKGIKILVQLVKDPKILILPYAFLLTGVGLKAALMPLFSWLPKAHGTASAPSIVSAILSGIFVKTGVYILIRLQIIFVPVIDLSNLLLWMGFFTAIMGAIFAISQSDIKLILSYHTISQIGLILIGLNLGNELSMYGAYYHVLTHGIFKALLFVAAGLCTEIYQSRHIKHMRGLWHHSKGLSLAILVGVFSITGAPFFSGGYSKHMIANQSHGQVIDVMLIVVSLGTLVSFMKFLKMIFTKKADHYEKAPVLGQLLALMFLSVISLCLGVFGDDIIRYLFGVKTHYAAKEQIKAAYKYVIMSGGASVLYFFVVKDKQWPLILRGFELTFNQICMAIVSFFALLVIYMQVAL